MTIKTFVAAIMLSAVSVRAYAQEPKTVIVPPAKQIDSVWNGALIGAGVGAVGAWIFTRANCGPRGYDTECALIAGPVGTAIFVPAGAITGAIIDRLINKTLPPGAKAHSTIAPIVTTRNGRTNVGVAFKMTIGRRPS